MKIKKLPNAPLQEVIFEAMWNIDVDENGSPFDPNFELAQGVYAHLIKKDFPFRKRTIPPNIPINIYPKPIHQFWKGENEWPVVQIGPGILAVNDTENNYEWAAKFRKYAELAINILHKSYEVELEYNKLSLRYIDAVELPQKYTDKDLNEFISDKFNIQINNNFDTLGTQVGLNLNQVFDIGEGNMLNFIVSNGMSNKAKPSIIWQTNIFTKSEPKKVNIMSWLDNAHDITSNIFKTSLSDEFYSTFK